MRKLINSRYWVYYTFTIVNQFILLTFASQLSPCLTTGGSVHASDLLYHPVSRKCYEIGTKGPCGDNMLLYRHPVVPHFGFCDCNQGVRSEIVNLPVRKSFYDSNLRKCVPVFSQGPCKAGYWVNYPKGQKLTNGRLTCEPNPCLRIQRRKDPKYNWNGGGTQFWFYEPAKKSCFQSLTQGYCPDGESLELSHHSHLPKCRAVAVHTALTKFRPHLTCIPGSRFSYIWRGCITKIPKLRSGLIG